MIPIRNLYAMLAFCWREADLLDGAALGACDFERPYDVAARLLDVALKRLFRRGLELSYVVVEDAGPRPRGSLDLARTTRDLLELRGQLAYRVDELSEDTAANRLLKCAALLLLRCPEVALDVRKRLRSHVDRLAAVTTLAPAEALRAPASVPRHERAYGEALWLARLTLTLLLPDEGETGGRTRTVLRDRLPTLFQGFVRGAARHFLAGQADVGAPALAWHVEHAGPGAQPLIPQMLTDACIHWRDGRRALIECKLYESPFTTSGFSTAQKFRAGHLYQVLGYLAALARESHAPSATLLCASPGGDFDESMLLEGFPLRVVWMDLGAAWPELRDQLVDIVSWRGAVRIAAGKLDAPNPLTSRDDARAEP